MRTAKPTSQNVKFPSVRLGYVCDSLKADEQFAVVSLISNSHLYSICSLATISEFGWLKCGISNKTLKICIKKKFPINYFIEVIQSLHLTDD